MTERILTLNEIISNGILYHINCLIRPYGLFVGAEINISTSSPEEKDFALEHGLSETVKRFDRCNVPATLHVYANEPFEPVWDAEEDKEKDAQAFTAFQDWMRERYEEVFNESHL